MSALTYAIGWTLIHFIWQGTLLGCAAAAALTLMRNARPEHRYAVACAALLGCLLWPASELYLRLNEYNAASANGAFSSRLLVASMTGGHGMPDMALTMRWVVGLWALCAAVLALRMALGLLWIDRAIHSAGSTQRAEHAMWQARLSGMAQRFGVTRPVRLRVVDSLVSPITAGWWRPVVLVPSALMSGLPPELLEALLAHELAHIKHYDYLVNLFQNVIETLLFYHPAVWWLSRRIRAEREQMADDFAAGQLGEPRRLALALSELERLQFSTHHLAQAANGGDLMVRIQRLVRPTQHALNWKAAVPLLGLAFACMSMYAEAVAADKQTGHQRAIADFNTCNKPVWPQASLDAKETGAVTLNFLIDTDGSVSDSKLKKSSGHPALDEAARKGIALCKFKPATKNGKPVKEWMQMQYVWTLE